MGGNDREGGGCIEGGPRASCFNLITFHSMRGGIGEAGWTRNKISLIHKNFRSVSRLSFCPREIKIPALGGRIIDNVGTRAGFPRSNFFFSFFFFFFFFFSFTHALLILNLILSLSISKIPFPFISRNVRKEKKKKRENRSSKKIKSNVLTNVLPIFSRNEQRDQEDRVWEGSRAQVFF